MISPIFIVGTQRSGSNLLRLMLNESKEIFAPHPPHILKTFFPLLSLYGDFRKYENHIRLVSDVCEFVKKNPVEWDVIPNKESVAERVKSRKLIDIMARIYEFGAEAKGANYWCCKSMANVAFLPEIYKVLPNAKFIYLYRDGRDVALSFAKAFVGEKHVYSVAKQWEKDQSFALKFKEKCPENQFFSLQYETFIQSPESELKRLCAFLGVVFQPEMMRYYQSKESQKAAESGEMWKNVVKPVLSGNHLKFLTESPPEQIRIFEMEAGETLRRLGYPILNEDFAVSAFSTTEIQAFEAENEKLKQEILAKLDPSELEKRKGQEKLLAKIKRYKYA